MWTSWLPTVALPFVLFVAGCAVIPSERVNDDCAWSHDPPSPIDTQTAAGRRHLRNDATIAEELAIRYADTHRGLRSGRFVGNDEYGRSREQCMATLVGIIARTHRVEPQEVRDAVRQRPVLVDVAAVFLPMAMLFVLAGDVVARWVCRRFPDEQAIQRLLAILLVSAFATVAGYQLGNIWSFFFEEQVRLRTNHLSYRAFFLPWSRHAVAIASAGAILFWLAALIRCRALRFRSTDPDSHVPTVDLDLR